MELAGAFVVIVVHMHALVGDAHTRVKAPQHLINKRFPLTGRGR